MKIQIPVKRIDESLPLPTYATSGSVGFDLICREDTTIEIGMLARIPGNVVVKVPQGYMLQVSLRSSTPARHGLLMPHGVGIIDQDYCGEGDEIKIQVYNFGEVDTWVRRGERIAQGIFVPVVKVEWEEVDQLEAARGGFGSTGS